MEPPGADFRGLGRFIGSLAGSTFAAKRLANKWWSAVLAEPSSIRRPPLAVMSVFETVEPCLAWPKSARIGFYGPRQHRRPSPPRGCAETIFFLPKSLEISPRAPFGTPNLFFELRAASGSDFRRLWAPTWLRRGLRRAPGSILGAILAHFYYISMFFVGVSAFGVVAFCSCVFHCFSSKFCLFSASARKRRTCENATPSE